MRNIIHFIVVLLGAVFLFGLQLSWFILYGIYCKLNSHESRMWWHDNKWNLLQYKDTNWLDGTTYYKTIIHYVIKKYNPIKYDKTKNYRKITKSLKNYKKQIS